MLLCVSACLSSFLWRLCVDAVSLWMPQVRDIPKIFFWIRNKTNGGHLFRDFSISFCKKDFTTFTFSPNIFLDLNNRNLWNRNHNMEPIVNLLHVHYNTPFFEHLVLFGVQKFLPLQKIL